MNSRDEAYLAAWQQLRSAGYPPELRLPMIDALIEIERAKMATARTNIGGTNDRHYQGSHTDHQIAGAGQGQRGD